MWITMAWQHISPELTVKALRNAMYPLQWMRLMMLCCGTTVKRMGMLGVSVRKVKALNDKGK